MELSIIGSGNVAAALAMNLAHLDCYDKISFVARSLPQLEANIRDAASAFPSAAAKFRYSDSLVGTTSDVIAVTAGLQIPPGGKPADIRRDNFEIAEKYISGHVGPLTKVILVGTPVDEITADVASRLKLDPRSVIGFGGDLDVRRLVYILRQLNITASTAFILGEHGSRAVPLYDGEAEYSDVAKEVRFFLKKISENSGRPRNLATGVLLAGLLRSLTMEVPTLHHVTTYCEEFDLYLTWPTLISREGVVGRYLPLLGKEAKQNLVSLVEARRKTKCV